jgi:undecaprenyl-phosphate galactose phosphotransferase/putative colanic acid biosynthesis UDP-glucose lipid carrier transferase
VGYISAPAGAHNASSYSQFLSYRSIGAIAAIVDCVLVVAASVATGIGYHLHAFGHIGDVQSFLGIGCNAAVLFVLLARSQAIYRPATLSSKFGQLRGLVVAWAAMLLVTFALLFLLKIGQDYSRAATVAFGIVGLGCLAAWHTVVANVVQSAVACGGIAGQPTLIIGERQELSHYSSIDLLRIYGMREIGRFELPERARDDRSRVAEPTLQRAIEAAQRTRAEIVLLALRWTDGDRYKAVCEHLRLLPLPVFLLPDPSVRAIVAQPLVEIGSDVAVEVQRAPLGAFERALKRLLDIVVGGAALVLLMPLLAAVAIAVKVTSRGPVIFKQHRMGFNGREFAIYKFRTMTVAEDGPTIRQARRNDSRVTRLGAILRRTSIDELPQLINVLRGEMSLVGPRPHALAHDGEYSGRIADYALRHHVKPGITGWAQVHGLRGATAQLALMERRVEFDLWYINNWSIWLDLRILLRTCSEVLRGANAY